jgi:RNA polymerase sigma factor (sigma-70 family)
MEPTGRLVRHEHMGLTTEEIFVSQSEPASMGSLPNASATPSENAAMAVQASAGVEHLYRTQRLAMVRLARLLTDSPAVAEEIVQEAFIRFARSLGEKDEPAAYLRVIVVNLCRSQQRRTLVERRVAPRAPLHSGMPEIDETWDLVRQLPFRQRAVLMLRYYEDLSEADIARLLRCRPGTVKSALHRGLAALRKELAGTEESSRGGQDGA